MQKQNSYPVFKRPNATIGIKVKANSNFSLSTNVRRLFAALLEISQRQGGLGPFSASFKELATKCGLEGTDSRPQALMALFKKSLTTIIEYNTRTKTQYVSGAVTLISSCEFIGESPLMFTHAKWMFDQKLSFIIENPADDGYTQFSGDTTFKLMSLRSPAAHALALIVLRYSTLNKKNDEFAATGDIPTSEWRAWLTTKPSEKNTPFRHFYRDCMSPAIAEVENAFGMTLRLKPKGINGLEIIHDNNSNKKYCQFETVNLLIKYNKISKTDDAFDLSQDYQDWHQEFDDFILTDIIKIGFKVAAAKALYVEYCEDLVFLSRTIAYTQKHEGKPGYLRSALKFRYVDNIPYTAENKTTQIEDIIAFDAPTAAVIPIKSDEDSRALSESVSRHLEKYKTLSKDEKDNLIAEWLAERPQDKLIKMKSKHDMEGVAVKRLLGHFMATRTISSTEVI